MPMALPESAKRFADGARYKIEIPSVEGPAAFKTVIDESKKHKLIIHRIFSRLWNYDAN